MPETKVNLTSLPYCIIPGPLSQTRVNKDKRETGRPGLDQHSQGVLSEYRASL